MKTPPVRLLVLGASGRIGRLIRPALSEVIPGQVRFQARRAGQGDIAWSPGDPMENLPKAQAVLSLWGATPENNQPLSLNLELALEAQKLAEAVGATRVFHSSSVAVYGPSDTPHSETEPLNPANSYGTSKAEMEAGLAALSGSACARPVILRIGSFAGAESLFRAIAAHQRDPGKQEIVLDRFADGHSARRSYIAPGDAASAFVELLDVADTQLPDILNFAAPAPVTMDALLDSAGLEFAWQPPSASVYQNAVLDCSHLQALTSLRATNAAPDHIIRDWRRHEAAI